MFSKPIWAGLVIIAISGCHSYRPYCNSCQSYPAMQSNQIYQPATIVPNHVQPGVPSNGGGNAPTFQTPKNVSPGTPNNGGPLAPEDDEYDPSSETDPGFDGANLDSAIQPSGVELVEIDEIGLEDADEGTELASVIDEDEGFEPPVPFQPASTSRTLEEPVASTKKGRPNPYLYDKDDDDYNKDGKAEAYEWLRGVVYFDEKKREWRITYNPDPTDKEDKYGGTFTILNDEVLFSLSLQSDDVVLVDGHVDIENPDRSGKPSYYVEEARRMEPIAGDKP